ncbi:MAG: hypothetical protein JRI23_08940 [Deltaproteobacteria bacterium]|nr:hypothetical protein [Deltaproteobacteria bacterium]MBW2531763.1 hypothetical protein [Deltaproteobacteria bacterium]
MQGLGALALSACFAYPNDPPPTPKPFEDGPLEHEVLVHRPEAQTGIATGSFEEHALVYGEVEVDPKYRHALSFQMTPMMPPRRQALATTGPLVLYSDAMEVLVFSPLDHFYESLVTFDDDRILYGVEGEIDSIPADVVHRFVQVHGTGVARTLAYWGQVLRRDRDLGPVDRYADDGLARLGYWTDNGGYYYYRTAPGMNEEQTMLAIKADADALGIPLGYLQLDSWWYDKEPGEGELLQGGVRDWHPLPEMFPNGLAAFQHDLGLPLVLHNRWFAPDNVYRERYEFADGDEMALPTGRDVFDELMADASSWGAVTYEQDWLMRQFWGMPQLRSEFGRASEWMGHIDRAAADAGLTVQICMAGAAFLMDAVDRPSTTTVRTSIDYQPDVSKESFWPQFHTVNMLAAGLGVLPFKDNFRSAEPQGEAEALISSLSAGMVGPSDTIGQMDAALLMRTARHDGLLLKPDSPAVPIDAMFLEHHRPYIVHARSDREGVGTWSYVAAFHLASAHEDYSSKHKVFALVAYDGISTEEMVAWPTVVRDWRVTLDRDLRRHGPAVIYDWQSGTAAMADSWFDIPQIPDLYGHGYFVVAPVFDNGLSLIGEVDKFVTVADRRFVRIEATSDGIFVDLEGAPHEAVTLQAYDAAARRTLAPVTIMLDGEGRAEAILSR